MVGLAVLSHQPGTVNGKDDMKALNGNVVDQHIVAPLKERGIDREHGDHPLLGHTGGHRHRVAFRDPHVKKARGIFPGELIEPRSRLHCGGDGADTPVTQGKPAHSLTESIGKPGFGRFKRKAGLLGEGRNAVIEIRVFHRRLIPVPLGGSDMEQNGGFELLGVAQKPGKSAYIVAGDRPQIDESHILEHTAREKGAFDGCLHLVGKAVNTVAEGQNIRQLSIDGPESDILRLEPLVGQVLGNAAHIFGDGHPVIVKYDDERFAAFSGVGESLIGEPAGERPVADERHDAVVLFQQGSGPCHAQRHGHRVGGVAGHKSVVRRLAGLGVS
ncbi:hypothetical protein SDC9_105619 [bioreactor metagenome]|uniref:Uncharacterized protein n=1 Tax=bioreactor metagenome TaxID=1076179 RepID=A0A645B147_9ZZZZ